MTSRDLQPLLRVVASFDVEAADAAANAWHFGGSAARKLAMKQALDEENDRRWAERDGGEVAEAPRVCGCDLEISNVLTLQDSPQAAECKQRDKRA